ncbi:Protein mlp1 [Batrachochytrium dendrobatidis]|nr:Protein mlp1 [Batrachochytrium dendrobatidis]KAK5668305.1 Protein mlp1 [Batrachochytrium dendrobatidis]
MDSSDPPLEQVEEPDNSISLDSRNSLQVLMSDTLDSLSASAAMEVDPSISGLSVTDASERASSSEPTPSAIQHSHESEDTQSAFEQVSGQDSELNAQSKQSLASNDSLESSILELKSAVLTETTKSSISTHSPTRSSYQAQSPTHESAASLFVAPMLDSSTDFSNTAAPLHSSSPVSHAELEPLSRLLLLAGLSAEAYLTPLSQSLQAVPSLSIFLCKLDGVLNPKSLESASTPALLATIERMKAQNIMLETEAEQRAHDSERESRLLASQLAKLREQAEQNHSFSDSNATLVASLRQEIRQKEAEIGSWHEKDLANQSLIQSLDSEKRTFANLVAKKQAETVRLTEELEEAHNAASNLRGELHTSLSKVNELNNVRMELQSSVSSREQQVEQLQKSNDWLSEELKRRSNQFSEYRREKTDQLGSLQTKLEILTQEKVSIEASHASLKSWNIDLEQKLHFSTEKCKETDSRLILLEKQFKSEMISQKRLTELYQNKSQELADQISELENLLRETESRIDQLQQEHHQIQDKLRDDLEQSSQNVERLQKELDCTTEKLETLSTHPAESSYQDPMGELSSTAMALSKTQKSGKSMTDIISEYHDLKAQLVRSQFEEERLNEMVQHIMAELEERAPMLHQNKLDLLHANEELERISAELSTALQQRTQALSETSIAIADKEALQHENRLLQQESRDLASQLQALLRQSELNKTRFNGVDSSLYNRLSSTTQDTTSESYADMAADDIISQRLVVFKNIEELQTQNQSLLKAVRSLTLKLEAYDAERVKERDEWQTHELEEAARVIKALQERLNHQTNKMQSFSNERDSWRAIAERRGASSPAHTKEMGQGDTASSFRSVEKTDTLALTNEYEQLYRDIQSEFSIFRKESGIDIKQLKSQIESVTNERTELNIQVATLKNQILYSQERDVFLNKKLQHQEEETSQLRKRLQSLMDMSSRHDAKAQELTDGLMDAKMSVETLQNENQQLKIEREVWKSSESRAMRDVQDLIRERNAANDRLRDLQHQLDERERLVSAEKAKLEDRLESLTRDIQLVRKQLGETLDDNRTLTAKRDSEQKESHIKIERLTSQIEKLRGELILTEHKEETLNLKCQDLSSRLAVAEERAALYEGRSKNNFGLGADATDLDKIRDLDLKLTQSKSQLEALKAEMAIEKERCAAFQDISHANEQRLAEMNGTYEVFKTEMEQDLAAKQATVEKLETEIADLQTKLHAATDKHTHLEQTLEETRAEFNTERTELANTIIQLRESQQQAIASQEKMHADVSEHVAAAHSAQENYEREVIAHSNTIQSVLAVKQTNRELYERAAEMETKYNGVVSKLQSTMASHEATRSKLEEQISEYIKRIEDLGQQNDLLHSQFEQLSLNKSRALSEYTDAATGDGDVSAEHQKQLDDLREVIRFLRREKSILDTRLEVAVQESQRLTLQVDHVQRSLDETRALLDEETKSKQYALGNEEKHRELLEKIEQANLLRESNVTLRDQNEQTLKRLKRTEARLEEVEAQLMPLRERSGELEAEIEARKMENKHLAEDNERWQSRTQQILQKYERIDPVEHSKLKEDVVNLTAARDQAIGDLAELRLSIDSKLQQHQDQITILETTLSQIRAELSQCRDELAQKDAVIEEVKARAAKDADDANTKLKDLVARSNGIAQKLKESKDRVTIEYRQTQAKLQETEKSLAEAVSGMSTAHTAEMEQQTTLQKSRESKWEMRQLELQAELDRYKSEIALLRQSITATSNNPTPATPQKPKPASATIAMPSAAVVLNPPSKPLPATHSDGSISNTTHAQTLPTTLVHIPSTTPLSNAATVMTTSAGMVTNPVATSTPTPIKRARDEVENVFLATPSVVEEESMAKRAKMTDPIIQVPNALPDFSQTPCIEPSTTGAIVTESPTSTSKIVAPQLQSQKQEIPKVVVEHPATTSITLIPSTLDTLAVQATALHAPNPQDSANVQPSQIPVKVSPTIVSVQQPSVHEPISVTHSTPAAATHNDSTTVASTSIVSSITPSLITTTHVAPVMTAAAVSAPVVSTNPPVPNITPVATPKPTEVKSEKDLHAETQRIKQMLLLSKKKKMMKEQETASGTQGSMVSSPATVPTTPSAVSGASMPTNVSTPTRSISTGLVEGQASPIGKPTPSLRARVARTSISVETPQETPPPLAGRGRTRGRGTVRGRGRGRGTVAAGSPQSLTGAVAQHPPAQGGSMPNNTHSQ